MPTRPSRSLETFPNPHPERDYEIHFECPEFTCLCPLTGQPDFATMRIRYIPDQPRKMWVEGDCNVRGGIHTVIRTEYEWEK
jgi:NADPH-dependent 7-cyano-7-deazaguanine reductase QueF